MKAKGLWILAGALALSLEYAGLAAAQPTAISACGSFSSGSYVLTQDINATGTCLTLTGDNITIDFNGFTIKMTSGSGNGITTGATPRSNIVIRNGTVRDFSEGIGLSISTNIQIDRMRVVSNASLGIAVGNNSSITNSIATNNFTGINAASGSTISGNTANSNFIGILVIVGGSSITNNVANNNSITGIQVECPSNLFDNTAQGNGTNLVTGGKGCKSFNNLF